MNCCFSACTVIKCSSRFCLLSLKAVQWAKQHIISYTRKFFIGLKCKWSESKELSNWLQICSSVHKRSIRFRNFENYISVFFLVRKTTFAARQGDKFCRLIMRVTSHYVNRALRVVRIWHVEACGWRYCAAARPNNVSCTKKTQYPRCAHAYFSEKWFAKATVDGFCAGYADTISSRRRQNIGALLGFTSSRAATPGSVWEFCILIYQNLISRRSWHLAKGSVPLSVLESSQSCRTSESNGNRSGRELRNTADYWFSLFCVTSWTTLPIILAGSL